MIPRMPYSPKNERRETTERKVNKTPNKEMK